MTINNNELKRELIEQIHFSVPEFLDDHVLCATVAEVLRKTDRGETAADNICQNNTDIEGVREILALALLWLRAEERPEITAIFVSDLHSSIWLYEEMWRRSRRKSGQHAIAAHNSSRRMQSAERAVRILRLWRQLDSSGMGAEEKYSLISERLNCGRSTIQRAVKKG